MRLRRPQQARERVQRADTPSEATPDQGESSKHLAQVARGGALGLIGAAVSAISGFVLVLVVTNSYPQRTAGIFFAATSAFLLLSSVATLGTETGLGRFMLRFEILGRRADIPTTLRAAFVPTILVSCVVATLLFVFAAEAAAVIGVHREHGATSVRVLAVLLPFVTLNNLALAGTRSFGTMRHTVIVDSILRSAAQPVLVLITSFMGAGLVALTAAWSIPYALAAGLSIVVFSRFLSRRGTLRRMPGGTSPRVVRREFWSFTWPRTITKLSQLTIQRLDIVLVAAMRSPQEAAVYTAATRFVTLGQFGSQAIQNVLQPKLTALIAAEDRSVLSNVFKTASAWSMAVTWPIYLIVGAAPLVYLGLFGSGYTQGAGAVVLVMAGAMLFAVATGPQDTLLLMSGRSGLSLVNAVLSLALDIALALLLIPIWGMTGAAVARAAAVTLRALLTMAQTRLTVGVVSFGTPAAVVAAAGIGCLALPLWILGTFVELDALALLAALVIVLPLYAGALWLARGPLMLSTLRSTLRRRGSSSP